MSATVTPLRPRARFSLLVVDADPVGRLRVSDELRSAGYRVLEASSRPDAEAILTRMPVHLLVLQAASDDGRIDGRAIARLVADLRPRPKLIVISDEVRFGDGADDGASVLAKPYDISRLVEFVRETLDPTGASGL